ncbi:MAG TPA: polyprenyl diphosphate synthase, partial [Geobacterales bacterium]|nr:polyprenyl diphosphate synthase [Geobacterales bacterium]
MAEIDCASLPRHLAIIMDGNGRWAEERMLQRIVGHQKGVETVRTVVEECSRLGIGFLTLYAFSAENWLRPRSEVTALMTLLKKYIAHELPRMMDRNVRFNVIGTWSDLPADVQRQVTEAMTKTATNTGLVLTLALSYGGR